LTQLQTQNRGKEQTLQAWPIMLRQFSHSYFPDVAQTLAADVCLPGA
jgi:hypothetical protein